MEFYVDLLKVSMVADPGFSANKGVLWGETAAVGVTASIPVIPGSDSPGEPAWPAQPEQS